jgi:hypothetical protein
LFGIGLVAMISVVLWLAHEFSKDPKQVFSPATPEQVNDAVRDMNLHIPAGIRVFRLEVFPSLTGNEVTLWMRLSEAEKSKVVAALQELGDGKAQFPIERILQSRSDPKYPWHVEMNSTLEADGASSIIIHAIQFYN